METMIWWLIFGIIGFITRGIYIKKGLPASENDLENGETYEIRSCVNPLEQLFVLHRLVVKDSSYVLDPESESILCKLSNVPQKAKWVFVSNSGVLHPI